MSTHPFPELPDRIALTGPGLKEQATAEQWGVLRKDAVATYHCIEEGEPCEECAPYCGETMRLPEAEELIPQHYGCRCHWTYDWRPELRDLTVTSLLQRASGTRGASSTMSDAETITKTAAATGVVEKTPNGEGDTDGEVEYIRVPISSTSRDRDGDRFSEEGLEDLRDQILSQDRRVFENHGLARGGGMLGGIRYDWEGIIGSQEDAEIETETGDDEDDEETQVLYSYIRPNGANEQADKLLDYLKEGMPVGFSVGFRVLEREEDEDGDQTFNRTDLLETSAVGIQSNPDAVPATNDAGTVQAVAKSVASANADLDEDTLAEAIVSELVGAATTRTIAPGDDAGALPYTKDTPNDMSDSTDDTDDTDELLERVVSLQEDVKDAQDDLSERVAVLEDGDEGGDTGGKDTDTDGETELKDLVESNEEDLSDLREDISEIRAVVTDDDTDPENAETENKATTPDDEEGKTDTGPGDDTGADNNGEWMV